MAKLPYRDGKVYELGGTDACFDVRCFLEEFG